MDEIECENAFVYEATEIEDNAEAKSFAEGLYTCGWRADDLEQIIADFDFTKVGAEKIVSYFDEFEPKV